MKETRGLGRGKEVKLNPKQSEQTTFPKHTTICSVTQQNFLLDKLNLQPFQLTEIPTYCSPQRLTQTSLEWNPTFAGRTQMLWTTSWIKRRAISKIKNTHRQKTSVYLWCTLKDQRKNGNKEKQRKTAHENHKKSSEFLPRHCVLKCSVVWHTSVTGLSPF